MSDEKLKQNPVTLEEYEVGKQIFLNIKNGSGFREGMIEYHNSFADLEERAIQEGLIKEEDRLVKAGYRIPG